MLETIKEYLPLEIWVLVIIATLLVMRASKRKDDDKYDDENDNHLKDMDIDWDVHND